MNRTAALMIAVIACTVLAAGSVQASGAPKPVRVKSGYFEGKNGNLALGAIVRESRRRIFVEFKAILRCPDGSTELDTAIDKSSRISRRGGFRARGPDGDPRLAPSVMDVRGRFVSPRRARGTFRLYNPANGCDSGQIAFRLRYQR